MASTTAVNGNGTNGALIKSGLALLTAVVLALGGWVFAQARAQAVVETKVEAVQAVVPKVDAMAPRVERIEVKLDIVLQEIAQQRQGGRR